MDVVKISTYLPANVESNMREVARMDGLSIAEFLDEAIEREVRRRSARRKALSRNQLSATFTPLSADLGPYG